MKTAIFNFLVLQIIVWAIVFSGNTKDTATEVNYAIITDTWEVAKVGEKSQNDLLFQNPTFDKLTLNIDGSYLRERNNNNTENGQWSLNESKTVLLLTNDSGTNKFEIIQLPSSDSQSFIIKENNNLFSSKGDFEYELTRM